MYRPKFKLHACKGVGGKEIFRPVVERTGVVETEQVVEEAAEMMGTRLSPYMVQGVVAGVLESMITKTLDDGRTRRFGDYFEVQLDLRGAFEDADEQFDPEKHKVKLTLRPLKRFRQGVKTGTPENSLKPPRARIEMVRSETAEEAVAKKGEDLIITGRNLKLVNLSEVVYVDLWTPKGRSGTSISAEQLKENSATRLVIDQRSIWGYRE